jgi:hypothetical protein
LPEEEPSVVEYDVVCSGRGVEIIASISEIGTSADVNGNRLSGGRPRVADHDPEAQGVNERSHNSATANELDLRLYLATPAKPLENLEGFEVAAS